MSPWRRYIADFSGLARIVSESVHKRTLATKLSHDIQTIKRWLTTGEPNSPQDVGWVIRIALQNGLEIDRFQTFHRHSYCSRRLLILDTTRLRKQELLRHSEFSC